MKINLFMILVSSLLFMYGCHKDHDDENDHAHELPTISVTQWSDNMEIFMEYETPVVGHEIQFIVHLTTLADFKAIREGKITLSFKDQSGVEKIVHEDQLLREGIFTPLAVFEKPGDYQFSIQYRGSDINDDFNIGTYTVYADDVESIHEGEEPFSEEIIFLKEQQWKLDFATEEAHLRPVKKMVHAVGEVIPRPESYAEIISPVEGIVSTTAKNLVKSGQIVKKGQGLAVLIPPLSAQNSWAEIYLNYEQAKAEFDRAQRLKERQAISERDYQTARRNYDIQQAGFSGYFAAEGGGATLTFDKENQQFILTAPIRGMVNDVSVLPGQKVDRHEKICSIVDPDKVWLRFDLSLSQAEKLSEISGASIRIPSIKEEIHLSRDQIKFISRGGTVDLLKHTIPVWLETESNGRLLIGQHFIANLYSGAEQEMITIPKSAVFDDNAQNVVFIHSSGESFEKRYVKTGPGNYEYIAIISGLKASERVVTRGGYQVKLASTSEEIGHGHTH